MRISDWSSDVCSSDLPAPQSRFLTTVGGIHSARQKGGVQAVASILGGGTGVTARVLIAEDEPNLVESLSFILSRAGCVVSAVFDGESVLERLHNDRPDVLILDVMLPHRTGRSEEHTSELQSLM